VCFTNQQTKTLNIVHYVRDENAVLGVNKRYTKQKKTGDKLF